MVQSDIVRFVQITVGTMIGAVAVIIFYAPFNIAPAGISGIAVILNDLLALPIGLVVLIGNLPLLYLAYRMLDGWKTVAWTLYILLLFTAMLDIFAPLFPTDGVSEDMLLNAIFAGIVGGVGGGLVYSAGATFGGTTILALILQRRNGMPLSTTFMYSNLVIVGLAGIFLGWESALLSLVALVMEGAASDYIMEGPSVIRTGTIITQKPREVADAIMFNMQRGVTAWDGRGMYTNQPRDILFVTVPRSQVRELREIVLSIDDAAFIVIGQGHVAYGHGFKQTRPKYLGQTKP